jgi:hypothetical protein
MIKQVHQIKKKSSWKTSALRSERNDRCPRFRFERNTKKILAKFLWNLEFSIQNFILVCVWQLLGTDSTRLFAGDNGENERLFLFVSESNITI